MLDAQGPFDRSSLGVHGKFYLKKVPSRVILLDTVPYDVPFDDSAWTEIL